MSAEVFVHRSNRTEALSEALALLLETPAGGPFDPETIVVQGRGMAVWLSHGLADRHGIAANLDFTFPRDFVTRAFRAVLGDEAVAALSLSEDRLLFAVLRELPALLGRPEFRTLAHYLREDESGIRAFQLGDRIATRFDQYVLYRPELIRAWEQEDDSGVPAPQAWQPVLFRAMRQRVKGRHLADLDAAFAEGLATGSPPKGLPRRIALFGVSTLPPLFVRAFARLARHVETHFFVFSPSPTAWNGDREAPALIESLGTLGAEFHRVLHEELEGAGARIVDRDLHGAPGTTGALGRVQSEIFGTGSSPSATSAFDDTAATIRIHSCHGPMREVEVLHDQLLDLFARKDGAIEPQHVVVMMPDVDGYAPFVEAVFDRAPRPQYIPYRISDRSVRVDSPAIEAFSRILGLVGKRGTASEILDLLNLECVRKRFGIDEADLDQLSSWVVESGIRWGFDERHREAHGQPAERENTWRFGLDRLLLGYAMPTEGRATFSSVLPYDEVEGKNAALLGKLAEFVERLFAELSALERARPLSEFRGALRRTLAELVDADRTTAWQHAKIEEALAGLETDAGDVGFARELDLAIVRELLERRLDLAYPERGFLTRGVTFCAMVPMRTIPFDVVCLLGMNDRAFPRATQSQDFDLIGRGTRRPGDRDRRKDDRHLFLEALMAARKRLIVTYTGQSIQDGSVLPPSVVVSELVDHVASAFSAAENAKTDLDRRKLVEERLVVRHPLQAFSKRYFDGSDARLFSYGDTYARGAKFLGGGMVTAPTLFSGPLETPPEAEPVISLDAFIRFFEDPVSHLLTRRLGLHLRDDETDIPDREPLELSPLEVYRVGDELLRLAGGDDIPADALRLLRATGALPPRALGDFAYRDADETVRKLQGAVAGLRVGPRRSVAIDVTLPSGARLVGRVGDCYDHGFLRFGYARVYAKHQIAAFLRALALSAGAPANQGSSAAVIGKGEYRPVALGFEPPADAGVLLDRYVEIYRMGLLGPLRFTPDTGLEYAENLSRGTTFALESARKKHPARDAWVNPLKPHLYRVFGDAVPDFADVPGGVGDFAELSEAICSPVVRARRPL